MLLMAEQDAESDRLMQTMHAWTLRWRAGKWRCLFVLWMWCAGCLFTHAVARMLLAPVFLVPSLRAGMLLSGGVQLGAVQCRVGSGICERGIVCLCCRRGVLVACSCGGLYVTGSCDPGPKSGVG